MVYALRCIEPSYLAASPANYLQVEKLPLLVEQESYVGCRQSNKK